MKKPFRDLSIYELETLILQKEPHLDELFQKARLLLQTGIVAIGRLQVILNINEHVSDEVNAELYLYMSQLAKIARHLKSLTNKQKAPAATEAQTLKTTEV